MQIASLAAPITTAASPQRDPKIWQAAQDFEAVLLGQLAQVMLQNSPTDGPFGGGSAEESWRGLMADSIGKQMARSGGIGLAPHVYDQMIRMQKGNAQAHGQSTNGGVQP